LCFGEQAMEVFEKFWQARERVTDDAVPVVGHEADGVKQHTGLGGCYAQAVADELVRAA
jgi:hypothetical protein